MKKYFISTILIFAISISSFCQDIKSLKQTLTRKDYLEKSKSQKTTAWVLLGAGLTSLAIVVPGNSSFETTEIVAGAATFFMLGSIPLFIASGTNKKKAMAASASMNFEKILNKEFAGNKTHYIPALTVKLNL